MSFTKFTSLESFGHVWRNNVSMIGGATVSYGAKIKLHGTNAAIRCEGGEVYAQKRTSDITPDNDNAGFAAWLEPNKSAWVLPLEYFPETVIYHGEWAGPGVQKGDAVSQLDKKMFFIFAVQIDDMMILDPELIEDMLPTSEAADDVVVLPWETVAVSINFSDPDGADRTAERMTELAEQAGEKDPFIADMFGIEGPGEGYVWTPFCERIDRDTYSRLTFKVKAARHGAKKAKAASRTVEIPAGTAEFVEMFVTEARCQQGLTEACDGVAEMARVPDFLKWMGSDVKKESEVELLDAGLEWKQVAKFVNQAAVTWFKKEANKPVSVIA